MSEIAPIVPQEIELGNTKLTQSSSAKKWCFTINNYSESEYDSLMSFLKSSKDNEYVVGKEIGENGTPHLQGYVNLNKRMRLTELKKINARGHFEKAKGSPQQNFDYCSKDDDFVSNMKVATKVKIITTLRPFQKDLEDMILKPVNEGKVIWIYDEAGQTGKTQLLRYLNITYGCPFTYGGKKADIINLIFNNKDYMLSTDKAIVIYNLPRETKPHEISYASMEAISDGCIANNKFEAGCFVCNPPHVIVFANCLPLFGKITKSRWIIKTIENERLIEIDPAVLIKHIQSQEITGEES